MIDAVLWINYRLVFRAQPMPAQSTSRVIVVPVDRVYVENATEAEIELDVDNSILLARFRQLQPGSAHFLLERGPPPGWRWIVHDGQLIADRVS
jgi:hypothetical protein